MKNPLVILKNKSGVALLIAITSIAIIAFIAVELSYDAASEYIIASQEINRIKARYAAKAGVEISLLRINIYHQAQAQFGQMLGSNKGLLDQIWSAPFIWPPILPPDANGVDKSNMQDAIKESLMDATFTSNIMSEGKKIDLTDLISPSQSLREITKQSLIRIFDNRMQKDDDFAKDHRDLRPEELVNNIIDWMDTDTISLNSGDESSLYSKIETDVKLPPNQPFKTLDELHMVAGITDEIFEILIPEVTIYGAKAIQVNHASKEILMSLAPSISEDVADKIIERRSGDEGPFKDQETFLKFLSESGMNTEQIKDSLPPLVFDSESNFRIQSIGTYGRTSSEIVAIVYDFDKVKEKLTEALKSDKNKQQSGNPNEDPNKPPPDPTKPNPPAPPEPQQPATTTPKGRPSVVYWTES